MNAKARNARYSTISAIATVIAVGGLYCFDIHMVQAAAIIVMACIIDSWRR